MLNYKKVPYLIVILSIIVVSIVGFALATNAKESNTMSKNNSNTQKKIYNTDYSKVKIEFLSNMMGFKSTNKFETSDLKIVEYIDTSLKSNEISAKNDDLENNYTNQYTIKLSNDTGGYSVKLYYDTLYDKAYIEKDGGLYETGTDFARYIDSFLENTNLTTDIENEAMQLFKKYGWTLDYKIATLKDKLSDITILEGFNPSTYYFGYNNELSKDIGLDMSKYSGKNISVDIYRINESMPKEFYPIQDSRAIVVKNGDNIIGAFISAGRHSTFNACSLKGRSFEQVVEKTFNEWFATMLKADKNEEKISKLKPEQVIEEYFKALDSKDENTAMYCITKQSILGNLTSNMLNNELFNKEIMLPLTDASIEDKSSLDNIKSSKLVKVELIDEFDKNIKTFRVIVDLEYKNEVSISSGEQSWDCQMIYESPQTGWKIVDFGH